MSQQKQFFNTKSISQLRNRQQYTPNIPEQIQSKQQNENLNMISLSLPISNQQSQQQYQYSPNIQQTQQPYSQQQYQYSPNDQQTQRPYSQQTQQYSPNDQQTQYFPQQNQQSNPNITNSTPPVPLDTQTETQKAPIYTENGVDYDQHGNILSQEYDLGIDGAFNDFSLLIGSFVNTGPLTDFFVGLAVKALEKKGFRVTFTCEETGFIKLLKENKYDVAWIISSYKFETNIDGNEFIETILDYHKKGGGLMIYADDEPLVQHANKILPRLVGCELVGNTPAGNTLQYGVGEQKGYFDENHLVFAGINKLYEGQSICYPDQKCKLKVLATSTDGNPCILCCEAGESNFENGGRIVVDTGWTKLYDDNWASAGQARYVVNATVWLLNLEGKFGMTVDDFM